MNRDGRLELKVLEMNGGPLDIAVLCAVDKLVKNRKPLDGIAGLDHSLKKVVQALVCHHVEDSAALGTVVIVKEEIISRNNNDLSEGFLLGSFRRILIGVICSYIWCRALLSVQS